MAKFRNPNLKDINDVYGASLIAEELNNNLIDFIEKEKSNKFEKTAFGIYGSWGIGKSTIIEELIFLNNEDSSKQFIKIDLWKYELVQNDLLAITKAILDEIYTANSKIYRMKKILKKAYKPIQNIIDFVPNKYKPEILTSKKAIKIMDSNDVSKQFLKLDVDFKNKKDIILIFDELDRCSATNIERYLNFIKHITLNLSTNIFSAIVMDYSYVKNSLFSNNELNKGNSFFNKIISSFFSIEDKIWFNDEGYKWIDEKFSNLLFEDLYKTARKRNEVINHIKIKYNQFCTQNKLLNLNNSIEKVYKNLFIYFYIIKEKTLLEFSSVKSFKNIMDTLTKILKRNIDNKNLNKNAFEILNLDYKNDIYNFKTFFQNTLRTRYNCKQFAGYSEEVNVKDKLLDIIMDNFNKHIKYIFNIYIDGIKIIFEKEVPIEIICLINHEISYFGNNNKIVSGDNESILNNINWESLDEFVITREAVRGYTTHVGYKDYYLDEKQISQADVLTKIFNFENFVEVNITLDSFNFLEDTNLEQIHNFKSLTFCIFSLLFSNYKEIRSNYGSKLLSEKLLFWYKKISWIEQNI